jgi:hypothetical protein
MADHVPGAGETWECTFSQGWHIITIAFKDESGSDSHPHLAPDSSSKSSPEKMEMLVDLLGSRIVEMVSMEGEVDRYPSLWSRLRDLLQKLGRRSQLRRIRFEYPMG